jgi:16S rRNA (guanine527-N7)-methyltransferase
VTVDIITRYFPDLSQTQKEQLSMLGPLYGHWNSMINVISRKDMDNFLVHHVLHSLSIAKIIAFNPGTTVLDVGTGGGFPGIPLAILFPYTRFFLLDSTGKKIKVVNEIANAAGLGNVTPLWKRAEDEKGSYDFVLSRAVTRFPEFVKLVSGNIRPGSGNSLENGIIYLKGGDLDEELGKLSGRVKIYDIKDIFSEPFFDTKKIIFLPYRFL